MVDVARAIPRGSRRAPSQPVWWRAVADHPEIALLRGHGRRNVLSVAWVLMSCATWQGPRAMCSMPGWDVLVERTGLGRSTIARWLGVLRGCGLLGTVLPGSTVRFRPGTMGGRRDDGRGRERALYVLTVPDAAAPGEPPIPGGDEPGAGRVDTDVTDGPDESVEETGTPSLSPSGESCGPSRARTRAPGRTRDSTDPAAVWPMTRAPTTRAEMLAACHRLQLAAVTLRRISARHLRHLLRMVFRRGASPADVLQMLDHRPDGAGHQLAGPIRHLPGWIRYRLGFWLTGAGDLTGPLPSQRAAAAATTRHRAGLARRAEIAQRAARSSGPNAEYRRQRRSWPTTALPAQKPRRRQMQQLQPVRVPGWGSGRPEWSREHARARLVAAGPAELSSADRRILADASAARQAGCPPPYRAFSGQGRSGPPELQDRRAANGGPGPCTGLEPVHEHVAGVLVVLEVGELGEALAQP